MMLNVPSFCTTLKIPKSLQELLASECILKCGVGVLDDLRKLEEVYNLIVEDMD